MAGTSRIWDARPRVATFFFSAGVAGVAGVLT